MPTVPPQEAAFDAAFNEATAPTYDTALSPEDEAKFAKAYPDAASTADYDLRGAFKDGALKPAANGHLPDTYKKPNHITFSTESKYNGVDGHAGGTWAQDANKAWTFTPGPTNLKNYSVDQLKAYFKKSEPDAKLILPEPPAPVQSIAPAGLLN